MAAHVESPATAHYAVANVLLPADPDELSPLDRLIHERRVKRAADERRLAAWRERDAQLRYWLNEILGGA